MWLRRLGIMLVILAVLAVPAYWWLLMESHAPAGGSYSIDMAEVRRLADSIPGDKPAEIRVETIAPMNFPATAVVAGDGWDPVDMAISAYQVVYADHTAIIDTAFEESQGTKSGAPITTFDKAAYHRMSAALHTASLIVSPQAVCRDQVAPAGRRYDPYAHA